VLHYKFVLLDVSAAFDTLDHAILLKRLTTDFGIDGKALEWFSSYLSGCSQRVLFEGATSDSCDLRFGVPQGSCLDRPASVCGLRLQAL